MLGLTFYISKCTISVVSYVIFKMKQTIKAEYFRENTPTDFSDIVKDQLINKSFINISFISYFVAIIREYHLFLLC